VILLAGLVVLAERSVGWGALLKPWKETEPATLAGALGLVLASYAIRTVRIHDYFHPATVGGFPRTFRLVLVHNLFNNLLPMRSGEASFPLLMAREFRVPFSRSIPGLVYLRVLDLHFVLLLGVGILLWETGPWAWILVLFFAPLPYASFRVQERLRNTLRVREGRIVKVLQEIAQGLPTSSGLFWKTWLWTAANWSVKLLVLAGILRMFTPMPFSFALMGSTTGELSTVLPFHGIAGAGTYEAGVMASLIPLGVDLEAALRAAVNLHLFVLGASISTGVVAVLTPMQGKNQAGTPDEDLDQD
jgi:hypothetical protein